MLPAKPLLFAQFAKTLLFFAISTCLGQALARADTDMQITAPPLVIHDPRDSANAQNATADWVKNYGGQLPLIYTTESGQGAADLLDQLIGETVTTLARLPLRLAVWRVSAQSKNISDPEVVVIHQLILDIRGSQIAAGEMRDARNSELLFD